MIERQLNHDWTGKQIMVVSVVFLYFRFSRHFRSVYTFAFLWRTSCFLLILFWIDLSNARISVNAFFFRVRQGPKSIRRHQFIANQLVAHSPSRNMSELTNTKLKLTQNVSLPAMVYGPRPICLPMRNETLITSHLLCCVFLLVSFCPTDDTGGCRMKKPLERLNIPQNQFIHSGYLNTRDTKIKTKSTLFYWLR